jgi:hypothetical protein
MQGIGICPTWCGRGFVAGTPTCGLACSTTINDCPTCGGSGESHTFGIIDTYRPNRVRVRTLRAKLVSIEETP